MFLNFLMLLGTVAAEAAASASDVVASVSGLTIGQITETLTAITISFGIKLIKVLLIWYLTTAVSRIPPTSLSRSSSQPPRRSTETNRYLMNIKNTDQLGVGC